MKFQKVLLSKLIQLFLYSYSCLLLLTLLIQMWISFLSVKSHISVLVAYEVWNENNWILCHICNNGACDFLKFESIYTNQWYSIIFIQFYFDCVENILSSNRPYRPSLSHVADRPSLGGGSTVVEFYSADCYPEQKELER